MSIRELIEGLVPTQCTIRDLWTRIRTKGVKKPSNWNVTVQWLSSFGVPYHCRVCCEHSDSRRVVKSSSPRDWVVWNWNNRLIGLMKPEIVYCISICCFVRPLVHWNHRVRSRVIHTTVGIEVAITIHRTSLFNFQERYICDPGLGQASLYLRSSNAPVRNPLGCRAFKELFLAIFTMFGAHTETCPLLEVDKFPSVT
jgi:hypothetical protein